MTIYSCTYFNTVCIPEDVLIVRLHEHLIGGRRTVFLDELELPWVFHRKWNQDSKLISEEYRVTKLHKVNWKEVMHKLRKHGEGDIAIASNYRDHEYSPQGVTARWLANRVGCEYQKFDAKESLAAIVCES